MTTSTIAYPKVVSRDEWLAARKKLLAKEKQLTRHRDALNAERRRLPMVEIDKDYVFEGPNGRASLLDLFDGRRQLIVYHFMFEPGAPPPGKSGEPYDEGCSGCSFMVDNIGHLAHLHARDTSLVLVSRAPAGQDRAFQGANGLDRPVVFLVRERLQLRLPRHDGRSRRSGRVQLPEQGNARAEGPDLPSEGRAARREHLPADDDRIFHAYSTYGRGMDLLVGTYNWLDHTPFGRQEDWEDSPEGWPQTPTHGWLRHHDKYGEP